MIGLHAHRLIRSNITLGCHFEEILPYVYNVKLSLSYLLTCLQVTPHSSLV